MQVTFKGGESTATLTKAEQRTLVKAMELCANLGKFTGEQSVPMQAAESLEIIISDYCDTTGKDAK